MRTKCYKNQKGSSSILVILTLLMLVLFGVLAMLSSLSDYKIAQKNALWSQDYYQFEGLAQKHIFQIDTLYTALQSEAEVVFSQWEKDRTLPLRIKSIVNDGLTDPSISLKEKKALVHFALLVDALKAFDSEGVVEFVDGDRRPVIQWTKTIILLSERKYLVQVHLFPMNTKHYMIKIWREIPKSFDYSEGMEFKDVEVIGS